VQTSPTVAASEELKRNRLLALLSRSERERLAPYCQAIEFWAGDTLYSEHDRLEFVYFPRSGLITSELTMADGREVALSAVGREGAICFAPEYSVSHLALKAVARLPGKAWRIPFSVWRDVVGHDPWRSLCTAYQALCLCETQQAAACHLLHDVESRLCRWLLHMHDRTAGNVILMTHAELSNLASIRRTMVTLFVGSLESAEIIANRRGAVEVSDRFALESAACECYGAMRRLHDAFDRRFADEPVDELPTAVAPLTDLSG
jgi:CRP-like cAMP-binding protein